MLTKKSETVRSWEMADCRNCKCQW